MFAMVGESAPPAEDSCWNESTLPCCEPPCLGVDLLGVGVEGSGREERELEGTVWSAVGRIVLAECPLVACVAAGELIPLSRSCSESESSSSVLCSSSISGRAGFNQLGG